MVCGASGLLLGVQRARLHQSRDADHYDRGDLTHREHCVRSFAPQRNGEGGSDRVSLGTWGAAARPAPDLRCGSSRWFVKGRFASNRANQRLALAGCPLGREASAARPAPDLRCGSSRWLVKGRRASNPANQRAALAGCPLGRGAAARPAPDLRCGSSRWLVKGRRASNPANQRAALAGCPLGREAPAARPAPDLPPGKALHASPRSGAGLV